MCKAGLLKNDNGCEMAKTKWDERYSAQEFVYGTEPNDFLFSNYREIRPGGRVLCLAEGEGRNAVFLARQGFEVLAVDQSATGLDKAEKLAESCGVSISTRVMDIAELDLGQEQWDGVVSVFAHVPPAVRKRLHEELAAGLKQEGVFIFEGFTPEQIEMEGRGGPPPNQAELYVPYDQLLRELEALKILYASQLHRHLSEGKLHQGLCSVAQVLAKKI